MLRTLNTVISSNTVAGRKLSKTCHILLVKINHKYIHHARTNRQLYIDHKLIQSFQSRGIYSRSALKIDDQVTISERFRRKFETNPEEYIKRLSDKLKRDEIINWSDASKLINLCQNEEHLDLLDAMLIKMDEQSGAAKFGNSVFKLYYHLNQVDRAYKNVLNTKDFGIQFQRIMPYKIAMSLQYDNALYDRVLELYDNSLIVFNRNGVLAAHHHDLSVLAVGSCLKMRTREAYEKAKKIQSTILHIYEEGVCTDEIRSYIILAALRFDDPENALNLLEKGDRICEDLKVMTLLKLKKYLELSKIDELFDYKRIHKETYDLLTESLKDIDDPLLQRILSDFLKEKKKKYRINYQMNTLEDFLLKRRYTETYNPNHGIIYRSHKLQKQLSSEHRDKAMKNYQSDGCETNIRDQNYYSLDSSMDKRRGQRNDKSYELEY